MTVNLLDDGFVIFHHLEDDYFDTLGMLKNKGLAAIREYISATCDLVQH
jgi:hypothetical protein